MMIMRLVSVSYGWPGAVDALAHWLTLLSLRSFLFCFTNTLLLYFVLKIHLYYKCCPIVSFTLLFTNSLTVVRKLSILLTQKRKHSLIYSRVAIFFALEECDWAEWLFEAALKSDGKAPG